MIKLMKENTQRMCREKIHIICNKHTRNIYVLVVPELSLHGW